MTYASALPPELADVTPQMVEAGIFVLSGFGCVGLGPAVDLAEFAASVYRAMVGAYSREPCSSPSRSPIIR